MKYFDDIVMITVICLFGCKNPADSTNNDPFAPKDSSVVRHILSGKLIYSKAYWNKTGDVSSTINELNLKDSSQRQIIAFNNSTLSNMALSPDGSTLAYVRADVQSFTILVAKIYLDSTHSSEIVISSSEVSPLRLFPHWTHDNKLAYLSFENLHWKLNIDGIQSNIDKDIALSQLSFSRDGKLLIYSFQNDSSHTSLYAYDLSTQSSHVLMETDSTYNNCRYIEASISSDCSTIVFIKEFSNVSASGVWLDGGEEIWTVITDGTNPKKLKDGSGHHPAWSPDEKYIAYLATDQIYIMNNDGSNAQKLNNSTYHEFLWSN